jgi:hypothetical protein
MMAKMVEGMAAIEEEAGGEKTGAGKWSDAGCAKG